MQENSAYFVPRPFSPMHFKGMFAMMLLIVAYIIVPVNALLLCIVASMPLINLNCFANCGLCGLLLLLACSLALCSQRLIIGIGGASVGIPSQRESVPIKKQ